MLFVFFIQIAVAQEIKVTGVVTDKKGLPIPGANIIVQGAKEGTQTNFDGEFTINVQTGQQLVISYLGMKSIVVPAKTSMKITLEDAPNELEAVLVVGYGTQTKRKSTDNIARVTAKDIQQIPVANVQNALVGKLAGVQITQTNGKVDGGINIRVRGAASISAGTEPLYVLDGIPLVTSDESTNGGGYQSFINIKSK